MTFKMVPSDPEFPYDIEELECVLKVPSGYPAPGKAALIIKNKEIPRGFQINIERGFDTIANSAPEATLLGLMNRLDKQLETILSGQMAETVKIVPNKGTASSQPINKPQQPQAPIVTEMPLETSEAPTPKQLDEARSKRQFDARQLEARFNRLQLYAKSADGLTYTLPLDSPKRSAWPAALQSISFVRLSVPAEYPLEPVELHLDSESVEARNVEMTFRRRAQNEPSTTLTQHFNYLSQHMKDMAISKPTPVPKQTSLPEATATTDVARPNVPTPVEGDKSHVHHIPRPPEWDAITGPDDSEDDESDESDYETGRSEDENDAQEPETQESSNASAPAERGILLSLPHLELHGIELLELTSLNVTVKCERCKNIMDIERLRNTPEASKMREESCKKCASTLAVRFRVDLIHANSVRAGYLDLDGCTIVDLLPRYYRRV